MKKQIASCVVAAVVAALILVNVRAAGAQPAGPAEQASASAAKGLAWLKTKQNPQTGAWNNEKEPPGFTSLAIRSFLVCGVDPHSDFITKGAESLFKYQKETGGIYKDLQASYNTAIAISALTAGGNVPEWQEPIHKAVDYLKSLQWSDTIQGLPNNEQPVKPNDPRFGGWGYGRGTKGRPDGSNLQLALDALHDAGLKPEDPAYQNALKFVTRMQNLSETNDQPWAGNDGGFIYTPANGGISYGGEYTDASGKTLKRSYGSMTYAGLKSMVYAGLSKDDPRVKAAWGWVTHNWSVDENPGMRENDPKTAQYALFYYYYTMARALHAYGQPIITDAQGKTHDWRIELITKLAATQQADGSWVGVDKWMEGNPLLATSFAIQALAEAQADLKEHPAGK